jgi:hypothetical protein
LPWSMWAIIEKFRMSSIGQRSMTVSNGRRVLSPIWYHHPCGS